jgi:hypothetical protein
MGHVFGMRKHYFYTYSRYTFVPGFCSKKGPKKVNVQKVYLFKEKGSYADFFDTSSTIRGITQL